MALTQEEKDQLDQAQAIIEQLRSKAMNSNSSNIDEDKDEIDEDKEFTSVEASSTKKSGSGR